MIENNIRVDSPEVDVEDTSSGVIIKQPFSPNDIKLTTPPMNLGDLIDMIQYGWINFDTDYQREQNLWTARQQSRLIESVLLGLRLPAFYFEEMSKKQWNIIDGLQRCCAIRNYCADGTLVLSDLEFLGDKFNGAKYDDLPFEIKRDIRMLPITVNLLNAGVPDEVKYVLFKRLNTGGIELTAQEIRNAVYQGKAIDVVKRMAQDSAFLRATGGKIPVRRKQDQDFVSRFIAFYLLGYENYQPDLENFINKSMVVIRDKADETVIKQMESDFHESMRFSYLVFGDEAFRKQVYANEKKRPLNKAYFEVVASVFAKITDSEKETLLVHKGLLVENLYTAMRESKSYNISFSGGTGQRDSVRRRFSWFQTIMKRSMDGVKIRITDDNKIEDSEL